MRIQVERYRGSYCFYIWNGCDIVDSCYGFDTAVRAAEYAAKNLSDLRAAKRIARRARWSRFFHTGGSAATEKGVS